MQLAQNLKLKTISCKLWHHMHAMEMKNIFFMSAYPYKANCMCLSKFWKYTKIDHYIAIIYPITQFVKLMST